MEAGPALNDLPFSAISPASETLRSGYGNSADRAVLLATALNYAEIPYRFVAATEVPAFSREQKKVVEIPMGIFSAVLIYLPQYGIYLNDTGRFAPLGTVAHAERFGLELTNGNPVIIRPNSDGAPKEVWKYQLKLNPDGGVSMQATHRVYGSCAAGIREFYTHTLPEKQKLYFQQVAARIRQGAEIVRKPIVKLDDPNSVTVQYELNIPQYAEIGGGYIQFAIPHLKLLAEYVRCGKARRETPAYHSDAMRTELYCSIQLPPEVKVVNPRPPRSEYKISTLGRYWERFEVSNNELRMHFALDIPVEKIEPQDYDRLVQLERKLLDPANNHIILKQEKRK